MMKFNMGLKSALIAVTMIVALPTTTYTTASVANDTVALFIQQNKTACSLAALASFIAFVDMKTNNNKELFKTTPSEDYNKLMKSFNLLDSAFYKNIAMLLRKYIAGRPIKFVQKDIPQEDGSTIKGKKVVNQAPYGALGLFDAYVLSQIKDFSEHIPSLAGLYILINSPYLGWSNAYTKASGGK